MPPAGRTANHLGTRLGARSRGWTASVIGHAALMGWLMCAPQGPVPVVMTSADVVPVILALADAVSPDKDSGARGGGTPERSLLAAVPGPRRGLAIAAPRPPREARPRPAPATVAVPAAIDEGLPFPELVSATAAEPPEPAPPATEPPAAVDISDTTGFGTGPGQGDGVGAGLGTGEDDAGTGRRRRVLIHGRVAGEDRMGHIPRVHQGRGAGPYVSVDEATTLRTHDFFPPLPAALWPSFRPYVVVVDLCVSAEGRVSDAAFVVKSSPALDPIVLAAVRTWRYRPRLVGGAPHGFCHLVTIQYGPV